jgi:hypothetical protein
MKYAHAQTRFLAMEYYWLILNRSLVVFTYPEGLYAWKFSGLVSTRTPLFFVAFEECTTAPKMSPGTEDFESMMKESGSFSIPRSDIALVHYVPTPKWGMGECSAFRQTVHPPEIRQIARVDIVGKPKRRSRALRRT